MAYRKVIFATGEYYHIYNRGSNKQVIFHDTQDYFYFQKLLHLMNTPLRKQTRDFHHYENSNEKNLVSIGAYCLMPNHFHILIKQEIDDGTSLFMKKILTSYAMFYNKKYKRTGVLFEGRFKAKYANVDEYLQYLFAYIHLNPLKIIDELWKSKVSFTEDYINRLKKYPYSSLIDYLEINRQENCIINKKAFPSYFPDKNRFLKDVLLWIHTKH